MQILCHAKVIVIARTVKWALGSAWMTDGCVYLDNDKADDKDQVRELKVDENEANDDKVTRRESMVSSESSVGSDLNFSLFLSLSFFLFLSSSLHFLSFYQYLFL